VNHQRFTIDGSAGLEERLAQSCEQVAWETLKIVGPGKLQALVLGGGYGRGEGGVLRTSSGDQPYNDLEFYVFLEGNRFLNERKFNHRFGHLGERLSPEAGLHVEFKIDSLAHFKKLPVSIFSYDLVAGHKVIVGDKTWCAGCERHHDPSTIPASEGSRLLLNRCTGLLLVREMLDNTGNQQSGKSSRSDFDSAEVSHGSSELSHADADFIGRNLAKAQLSLGDSVLAAFGRYHWSCLERERRLTDLVARESMPWLQTVQAHFAAGVDFKLHPRRICKSRSEFDQEFKIIAELALQVWLWLEARRLGCRFQSARDYSFYPGAKQAGTSWAWNYLLNVRSLGAKAALAPLSLRYPRERLLNALSLLLWKNGPVNEPQTLRHLQNQLCTNAADRTGFVRAYKKLWMQYG
jgi:hypothetical protein